jgi:uncharacterized caspase-like protein
MRIPTVLGLAAALLLLVAHAPGQNTAPKRLALLMGVSDYSGLRLGSSPANLKVMDHALRQAGFKVTMLTDPTKDAAQEAIWRFAGKLQATPGAVAVFYFAGASVSDDTSCSHSSRASRTPARQSTSSCSTARVPKKMTRPPGQR